MRPARMIKEQFQTLRDTQASAIPNSWKILVAGFWLGALLAGSAWSHVKDLAATSYSNLSPLAPSLTLSGVEQRVFLADGQQLRLAADGTVLTLWDSVGKHTVQRYTLSPARINASLTLLPSGRVLLWGGRDSHGQLLHGGFWVDPQTNELAPAQNLPLSPRAGHTATVLSDGRVLFAGGQSAYGVDELWDELDNRSVALFKGSAIQRAGHHAQLQADGRVRISNGVGTDGRLINNELVFDAVAGRFVTQPSRPYPTRELAPGLAASIPAQGEEGISPDVRLSLRFTQRVRMRDLSPTNVILIGPGGATQLQVMPAEAGRLVFIQPIRPLFPDSKYTLLVNGVHTVSGLPTPLMAVDFKTAPLPVDGDANSHSAFGTVAPQVTTALTRISSCRGGDQSNLRCRSTSRLRDGIWTPGRDNTEGRWRLYSPSPEPEHNARIARIAEVYQVNMVRGRILQVDQQPVGNVEVSIGSEVALTDANGWFTLIGVSSGRQELYVDGSTANRKGKEYGQFVVGVDVARHKLTELPYVMYLPRITARDKINIPSPLTRDVVLTHPDMPGLMVQIPAGTVLRDRKGRLVRELALVPTPVNRAPFPVAENYPLYFTIEPGGALVQGLTPEAAKGIRIFYPNYDGHPRGTQADFWIYDPAEGWRVYGKGRVTSNGKVFSPEAGVALHQTMGGSFFVSKNDPPSEEDKPPCSEGCRSFGSGRGAIAGDPIDLRTGQFSYSETDIAIADVMPITLQRNYRPNDTMKREFGIGTAAQYNFKLYTSDNFNTMTLTLPGGSPIIFSRISGSGPTGSWKQSGASSTAFDTAVIQSGGDVPNGYKLALQDGSTFHFGKYPNPLVYVRDRFGNTVEFIYEAGLVSKIVSKNGRYISLEYDTQNRIHYARDNLGRQWIYEYNISGLLSKVIYPDQTFKQYDYRFSTLQDSTCPAEVSASRCNYIARQSQLGNPINQHAIESITDQRGHRIIYNEFESIPLQTSWIGRVIKQTQADNSVITIDYQHLDNAYPGYGTLVTNPDSSKRRIGYDGNHLYPKTDIVGYGTPQAQVFAFERDGYGRMTARVDPLGRRTEYQYNSDGQATQATGLTGTAQARSVKMTYTASGDLETVTDPLNRVTRMSYTMRCLTAISNAINQTADFICNNDGQPIRTTDPLGRTSALDYDAGSLVQVTDAVGHKLKYSYDVLARLISVEDNEGNVVRREYDVMGRVKKSVDAVGEETEYEYDANGNLTAVLLPNGNGVTYTYDERDRLKTRTDALGQVESWTYDTADRVETYTDRKGQKTTFKYDVLGRLELTTYHDGSTAVATYDAGNRLRTLADSAAGTLSWDYNEFDQLTKATTPQGSITYGYDGTGRRSEMIAASQPKVEYHYDDGDRLRRILQGSEVVEFDYDDANRLTKTTLPNGVKAGYAYNDADQLTGIAWLKANDTQIGDLGYGYDAYGKLVARTGSFVSQNLPSASTGANAFDDNNRQTQYNGQTLSYDANGNLTSDGVRTFIWNARDQLVEIKQGNNTLASFQYDATGRRIGRLEGGQSTTYLYDGADAVQETKNGVVNPILTGLGVDQHFARNDAGGRTYFLTDALGSTRALTNASGDVVQRYDYTGYGITSQTASGFSNPYQYTGREQDASGLYYYRARYYHPGMARFISEDSYGFGAGDTNFYAYALGNPVNYNDPSGHIVPLLFAAAWGLVELGLSIYDLYDTGKTLMDPCVNGGRKFAAVGAMVAGVVFPGNYSWADDAIEGAGKRFFRGSRSGDTPSFVPRPNEYKVDPNTGFVKDTHGVSVFDNSSSLSSKGFVPHEVDQGSIPDSLRIIQRGNDPHHFEIVPKPGANLTPEQFINACSAITCK